MRNDALPTRPVNCNLYLPLYDVDKDQHNQARPLIGRRLEVPNNKLLGNEVSVGQLGKW